MSTCANDTKVARHFGGMVGVLLESEGNSISPSTIDLEGAAKDTRTDEMSNRLV